MKSAITISLVQEAAGGPFVFWHDIDAAAAKAKELGFDALEVFPPDGNFEKRDELKAALDRNDLKLAAMGTGAGAVKHKLTLTSQNESVRRDARAFIKGIISTAALFGAPAIIGSMQGRVEAGMSRAQVLQWLQDALEELGDHAAANQQLLFFEPLNRYETNVINSTQQGLELLSSLRAQNVRLLTDLFHTNIEEQDVAAVIRLAGPAIGHIHLADSNRRAAGFGHTDFAPIARALKDIRFEGYLSGELLPWPNGEAAAAQTIDAFKALTK